MTSSLRRGHKITVRDLIFAAINGAIFGLGFTVISNNAIPFFPQLPLLITTLAFSILAAMILFYFLNRKNKDYMARGVVISIIIAVIFLLYKMAG